MNVNVGKKLNTRPKSVKMPVRHGFVMDEEARNKAKAIAAEKALNSLKGAKTEHNVARWLSFAGRSARGECWLVSLLVGFVGGIVMFCLAGCGLNAEGVSAFCGLLVAVIVCPTYVRRLHDINLSGALIVLMFAVHIIAIIMMLSGVKEWSSASEKLETMEREQPIEWFLNDGISRAAEAKGQAEGGVQMANIGSTIWLINKLIWLTLLGLIPGTVGSNQYGADPFGRKNTSDIASQKMTLMEDKFNEMCNKQESANDQTASLKQKLEVLASLKADGIISETEYEEKRRKMLDSIVASSDTKPNAPQSARQGDCNGARMQKIPAIDFANLTSPSEDKPKATT